MSHSLPSRPAGEQRPPRAQAAGARRSRSAVGLLADEASRSVLVALADAQARGPGGVAITEEPLPGTTPRVVRERLRELERASIVAVVDRDAGVRGAPTYWALTDAGRDLHRLLSLINRIVTRASSARSLSRQSGEDRAVAETLGWFADPGTLRVLGALAAAHGPVGPVALEAAAEPMPRRTLYRRLRPLLDAGAVTRIPGHTVPRSTHYELADRWRPVAAIPVLGAWWESRHWPAELAASTVDLRGVVHCIAPHVRLATRHADRRVRFAFDDEGSPDPVTFAASSTGIVVDAGAPETEATKLDAQVAGTNAAWSAALVTDRSDGLSFGGDEALARDAIVALRAALLAYVR